MMIIADKILYLRKKHNLTQEDLADQLKVSRQSISKWESATSIPDITKIMAIADFFSVSVDYLLKDGMDYPADEIPVETTHEHLVTIEEANDFLLATKVSARKIALGVFLCIISPVVLIFLGTSTENHVSWLSISDEVGIVIGLVVLFALIAIAVALFVFYDAQMKPYDFYKKGEFDLSFGVSSVIKEKQNAFMPIRTRHLILSVFLFLLAPLPLITVAFLDASETVMILMLLVLLFVIACSVYNLLVHETPKEAFEMLLKEEEFQRGSAEKRKKEDRIAGVYWPLVVVIYLGWSFSTGDWHSSWVIWPIAGLLFAAIVNLFGEK